MTTYPFDRNPNMLVPWYLMASYAYYIRDESFMPDSVYDNLCWRLYDEWDDVQHRDKVFIDREWLEAGTCFLSRDQYPTMAKSCACHRLGIPFEDEDFMPRDLVSTLWRAARHVDGLATAVHHARG